MHITRAPRRALSITLLAVSLTAGSLGFAAAADAPSTMVRAMPPAMSPAIPLTTSSPVPALPIVGLWDVTVCGPGYEHPAWFEIREESGGLTMRFVGAFGGVADVPYVSWDGRDLEFQFATAQRWRGRFNGRWLAGSTGGENETWSAVRAPRLAPLPVRWAASPVRLFDGRTLAGWRPRHAGSPHGWTVRGGVLANIWPGDDLVSLQTFSNFKLSLQYRLQPQSDSGVHLRGRYEVQLTDREDPAGFAGTTGSIYSRLEPSRAVACKSGDWNTLEVTLVGREVTVVLNTVTIIDRERIDGITGDALDSREGAPGPIVLQGYLGRVEFRHVEVTPAL